MPNKKITVLIVIVALFAAVFLPIVLMGYAMLNRAESEFSRGNYADAAASFARSACLLPWRDDLWEKAGIAVVLDERPSDAIAYFRRAPSLTEEGWTQLGFSHLSLGDFTSAIAALRRGLQSYDSPSLYRLLAFAYRSQKNWDSEQNALENQLRLDSNGADAYTYYRLGLLLTLLEPDQALTNLMLASSLDPEVDPAVQTLRTALNLSSTQSDVSQQMVTNGRALGLVQEWDLALAAFEKAVALDEKNAEAWAWLGEAKQQIADLTGEAVSEGEIGKAELDKAVALDPTSVVVRGLRALYWNRKENYPRMLTEYSLAAKSEPDNPAWQAGIGGAYVKNGDLVSALAAYQRATELGPNESTYWRLLAVFCAENGVHLEDVGLAAAQKAVEISPDDPAALDALGWVYLSSGRYANAEQTLLDVTSRFSDYLPAQIHLAMTYLAQGNRTSAFEVLKSVQSADPNGAFGEMAKQLLEQYFP